MLCYEDDPKGTESPAREQLASSSGLVFKPWGPSSLSCCTCKSCCPRSVLSKTRSYPAICQRGRIQSVEDPKSGSTLKNEDPQIYPKYRNDHVEGDPRGQTSDPNAGSIFGSSLLKLLWHLFETLLSLFALWAAARSETRCPVGLPKVSRAILF